MAIKQVKVTDEASTRGGTRRGNTFISTGLTCWWQFALRYIAGIVPVKRREYFTFGSVFHAVLEGQPESNIREWAEDQYDAAADLAKQRLDKGPPMPKATAVEKTHSLFGGLMTSKPDREEPGQIRDFKTAAFWGKDDEAYWDVEPGIIGEIISAGAQRGLVDVIKKNGSAEVRIFTVELTPEKERALRVLVEDFWKQLLMRLEWAQSEDDVRVAMPKNMKACVGKYGKCVYYERCWRTGVDAMLYKREPEPPYAWVPGKALGSSIDPKVLTALAERVVKLK